MSLTLTVDGERWRSHLLATVRKHPGIVPVAKGNGYGLTLGGSPAGPSGWPITRRRPARRSTRSRSAPTTSSTRPSRATPATCS